MYESMRLETSLNFGVKKSILADTAPTPITSQEQHKLQLSIKYPSFPPKVPTRLGLVSCDRTTTGLRKVRKVLERPGYVEASCWQESIQKYRLVSLKMSNVVGEKVNSGELRLSYRYGTSKLWRWCCLVRIYNL
jgi:hypothetical protein